ncbi:MAG: AMP-binding protein [Candidatus Eisenbacteria bacterium]
MALLRIGRLLPHRTRRPARWLYRRLPFWWRAGDTLRSTYAFLEESQHWSREQTLRYQTSKLKEVVRHAGENVPGYRDRFAGHGVGPEDIRSLDDIRRLPCLTKEDLQRTPAAYAAENIAKELLEYVTSGGTTGRPTGFYHIRSYNHEVAAAYRLMMWKRVGYKPDARALDLTASFDGEPVQYAPETRTLYVSISALSSRQFKACVDRINDFRPQFIFGFPSTVTLLAQLAGEHTLSTDSVRAIITASEVMYDSQRSCISDVFGCRIFSWYGMAEYAAFASGCERSDQYHFFPESGCLEILDEGGDPVTEEGGEGEIVLTGFHNLATPFIRYRTGDRGVLGKPRCDLCGRNHQLVKTISGRTQEFLVAQDGRLIPNSALNVHSDIFDHVWMYQFHQQAPGKVRLDIVGKPACGAASIERIRDTMLRKLGPGVDLDISLVEKIKRTKRGKHRFIVQRLEKSAVEMDTSLGCASPFKKTLGPGLERAIGDSGLGNCRDLLGRDHE